MRAEYVWGGVLVAWACSSPTETSRPSDGVNGAGEPSDTPNGGLSSGGKPSAQAGSTNAQPVDGGAAGQPDGGTPSAGRPEVSAGHGGQGSPTGQAGESSAGQPGSAGEIGSSAGQGGAGEPSAGQAGEQSSAGAAGTGQEVEPDPCGPIGYTWKTFTVEPGHCLRAGDPTWQGQQVWRDETPNDATCDAEQSRYLYARPGAIGATIVIDVLVTFGTVYEGLDTGNTCNSTPKGLTVGG